MRNKIPNRKGSKTHPKLDKVISYWINKKNALDLGCGAGANSIYLAKQGFEVTCVESNQNLINKFRGNFKKDNLSQKIKILKKNIKNFFPTEKYDLILALSVLHFFRMRAVRSIANRLKGALREDGVIFIRVLSNKDDYFVKFRKSKFLIAPNEIHHPIFDRDVHYFGRKEVQNLLLGLDIIDLQEYERISVHRPKGKKHKHWMFDVVARKRSYSKK